MWVPSLTITSRRRLLARAITAVRRADSDVLRLWVSAMMAESGTPPPIRYSRPTSALGVLVAALAAAQGDDQGRDAAFIEDARMVQPGAEHGEGRPSYSAAPNTTMASEGAAWSRAA